MKRKTGHLKDRCPRIGKVWKKVWWNITPTPRHCLQIRMTEKTAISITPPSAHILSPSCFLHDQYSPKISEGLTHRPFLSPRILKSPSIPLTRSHSMGNLNAICGSVYSPHKPRHSSSPVISPNSAKKITIRPKNNKGPRHFRGRWGSRSLNYQESSFIDISISKYSESGPFKF